MNDNTDLIVACPACDSASVKCNVCTDLQGPNRDDTTRHRCEDCGHRFPDHEAVRRERKIDNPPKKGSLARALYDADPDDLATDGGSVQDESDEKGRPCKHGIDRPDICVDTLDYEGAETHQDSIEGEVTRHYYSCPYCEHPISTWMDCPECLWYDEDVWTRTLAERGDQP